MKKPLIGYTTKPIEYNPLYAGLKSNCICLLSWEVRNYCVEYWFKPNDNLYIYIQYEYTSVTMKSFDVIFNDDDTVSAYPLSEKSRERIMGDKLYLL